MVYPAGLTVELQWFYGAAVLVINLVFYGFARARAARRHRMA